MTREEKRGLKSLMKKMSKGEILIMKTDKSGKMSVTNREKYIEMGQAHIGEDKEVDRVKIIETDRILNEHSAAWCSMWSTGKDHDHQDRILHSKTSRSENRANLYLSYKDHKKEKEKTRPIGTANSSNTRAFANSVSDLLESVANSGEDKFEVISSEDMLYHTKESNERVRDNNKEMEDRRNEKKMCWNCKVWRRKCSKCQAEKTESGASGDQQVVEKKTEIEEILERMMEEVIEICSSRRENCAGCEDERRSKIEKDCSRCGGGVYREDESYALVGMDAVALFPSLSGKTTARIVKKKIIESRMKCEGFNWKKATIYILNNKQYIEKITTQTRRYFPVRRKNQGTQPGINSKGLKNIEGSEEEQWFYPRKNPSEEILREMIGLVAQVGIRILWEHYCYDFGGRTYLQAEGGPIGQRPTMAASRLVMEDFFQEYKMILEKSTVKVMMMKVYVDDGRQVTTMLRKGMRYQPDLKEFRWDMESQEEDEKLQKQGEGKDEFMARLCLPAMNDINKDLTFTAEVASDFSNKRLPTLDFNLWQEEEGILTHSYYEKEMKTQLMIEKDSAMAVKQKYTIMTNELTRRLYNIDEEVPDKEAEIEEVLETFTKQLKNSG